MFGRSGECLYGVWKVSERSLEGVWKVIGSFLDQLEIQSKFNLLSTLTWDFTMIKMKTFTWNSSVALLSPTCFSPLLQPFLIEGVHIEPKNGGRYLAIFS